MRTFRFTPEQISFAESLWPDGNLSMEAIARKVRISSSGLSCLAKRLGWPPRITLKPNYNPNSPWNEKTIARAHELYIEKGYSANETAREMGSPFTRRSVIGISNRQGWHKVQRFQASDMERKSPGSGFSRKPKPPPTAQDGQFRRAPESFADKSPRSNASKPLPGSSPRPWTMREAGMCTWVIESPTDPFLSCCEPVYARGWCERHYVMGIDVSRPKANLKSLSRMVRRAA